MAASAPPPPSLPAIAVVIGAVAALQAFVAARTELSPDEAYYLLWSRHLAWGYFDHPPMVAFWIRASTTLFGETPLGVRALGILALPLAAAALARAARLFFGETRAAFWAAWLFAAPLLIDAGGAIATPDAPLSFFWALAVLALAEIYAGSGAQAWGALGVALGAAGLSKFTAAFLGAGVALATLVSSRLRPWSVRPAPYVAAALALALVAPFLAWNATHDWATFGKQFARVPPHGFATGYLFEFAGAQAGLLNPLLLLLTLAALRTPLSEPRRVLVALAAPALLYFVVHALHDRVQGNWPAPLYVSAVLLAAAEAAGANGWRRRTALAAPPLGIAATALVALQAVYAPISLDRPDPTAQLSGWRELASDVTERARAEGASYVLSEGYALTAEMKVNAPTLAVEQPDERARWAFAPPPAVVEGTGLAVAREGANVEAGLHERFRTVEPLAPLERRRSGVPVQRYAVFKVADPTRAILDDAAH